MHIVDCCLPGIWDRQTVTVIESAGAWVSADDS